MKPMLAKSKNLLFFLVLQMAVVQCVPNTVMVREEKDIQKELPTDFPNYVEHDESKVGEEDGKKAVKPTLVSKDSNVYWDQYFSDPYLQDLIGLALGSNQELNIVRQEINIANNEIMARQGEYIPKVGIGGSAGLEKVGEMTHRGRTDDAAGVPKEYKPYSLGLNFAWEVDIWKKLRNATKSALHSYLATIDGKNFMVTQLVAEVSRTYYELLALDQQLEIVEKNLEIQTRALELVKLQQQAARVTRLAVKRFEAEVLKNQSRRYELRQQVIQTENKMNFLLGRYPRPIPRDASKFLGYIPQPFNKSLPSDLLSRRPDVRQSENKLKAAKLDVKVAKARFYPSLSIDAHAGYESFEKEHLFDSPQSVFYNLAGNLTAPLLNRQAIKADYLSANNKQLQAVYDYEKTLINAYTEVANQMAKIENFQRSFNLKSRQVAALNESVDISNILFKAARADYVEVLMTRRDALESQMELVEIQLKYLNSYVDLYQSLGGGWDQDKSKK